MKMKDIKEIADKYKVDEKEVLNTYKFFLRNFGSFFAKSKTIEFYKNKS